MLAALVGLQAASVALWLSAGAVRGRLALPSRGPAAWAAALAALSFVFARFGPVPADALPAWAACAAGLWLIPAATLLGERERGGVERAVRAAAWVLVLLAVHQRFHGQPRPPSALIDENAFAGAILLLLPFAARGGDGFLAAGLLLCLWWTHSAAAWLGLAAALVLHRRALGPLASWAGAFSAVAGLGLASRFAPRYFLETAAERGWPFLLLWIGGIAVLLRRAPAAKRFGPVAALAQGLFGSALGRPGLFWLFCLSIAWVLPRSEEAVAVRWRRRAAA